jgi:hypothetical protein|tara:strand:- start:3257 stop:3439 length:183 start_codon:yes stop_codon:yes gene_type:complete
MEYEVFDMTGHIRGKNEKEIDSAVQFVFQILESTLKLKNYHIVVIYFTRNVLICVSERQQ